MKGFNPIASLTAAVKAISDKLDSVISTLADHTSKLNQVFANQAKLDQQILANQAKLDQILANQAKLDQILANQEYLISELSRFKGDSDSLLVSIFGYCHITGYRASQGEMKHMGAKASRFSRKFGYHMSKTQDPRFGEVGLYDPELLRDLFPVSESDEDVND